ncbi:MAG: tRNA (guanosine(46)-N7)-methyltransferase TrmB [Acetivibrio sp.]
MRLRNIPGAKDRIARDTFVIQEPKLWKGRWKEVFGNSNPIQIEIGMGKGKFIQELAGQNPDINYVGIERYSSVLLRALEKREEVDLGNLFYIEMNAEEITEIFEKGEVKRIYLNFSDPWPKERHVKRRLTSRQFLARYQEILSPEGQVIFKTDNRELFDFSLEEVKEAGWNLINYTYDLHHSEYREGNVMTEYEEKFSKEGKPINRLVANRT